MTCTLPSQESPMLTLPIYIIMLLPQLVAGLRGKGPAAHLTLLLLSLCAVITLMTTLALHSGPLPPEAAGHYAVHLPPLVWPVLGMCLLVPFYGAIEHICTVHDLRADGVLVQALALTLTAALWSEAYNVTPLIIEGGALVLVVLLFARGIWLLAQTYLKK